MEQTQKISFVQSWNVVRRNFCSALRNFHETKCLMKFYRLSYRVTSSPVFDISARWHILKFISFRVGRFTEGEILSRLNFHAAIFLMDSFQCGKISACCISASHKISAEPKFRKTGFLKWKISVYLTYVNKFSTKLYFKDAKYPRSRIFVHQCFRESKFSHVEPFTQGMHSHFKG